MNSKYLKNICCFVFIYAIMVFLAMNKNSRTQIFTYQSEIFSDKAGYYVYFPATVIYNWNANAFPDSIAEKTGDGFKLINSKVYTKYPCGVAILQSPFLWVAHIFATFSADIEANGFSKPYHKAINFASAFYATIGLIYLFHFLAHYFPKKIVFLSLAIIVLGTNFLFYTIRDTGMSHIYSFAFFSIYLYLGKRAILAKWTVKYLILIGLTGGMIVLLRQINIVFLPVVLLLDIRTFREVKARLLSLLKVRLLIAFILSFSILLIPQVFYYYYISGKFVTYSYGNEGFIYLANPRILHVLFSPNNGLFLYNPILMLIWIGLYVGIKSRVKNNWLSLTYFVLLTIIVASWWSWPLGCGYGHRGFIEFYSILLIPFTTCIAYFFKLKLSWKKVIVFLFIGCSCFYNLKNTYKYDGCYLGEGNWDWKYFINFLT